VVDWPRWIWWPILHGIILRRRPARSARLYRRIWTADGSPLLVTTRAQAKLLAERLGGRFDVEVGMRYGQPTLETGLLRLAAREPSRLLVLPMFPQRAEATSGSIRAAVVRFQSSHSLSPPPEVLPGFHTDPGYLDAVAASIREADASFRCHHLLVSFHGLPARLGGAYAECCRQTYMALLERLARSPRNTSLCFQSRFGPERWLGPSTRKLALCLAPRHPKLLVVCPGFCADCLETLDEIGSVLASDFLAAGGQALRLVPGLDQRPDWIAALEQMVRAACA